MTKFTKIPLFTFLIPVVLAVLISACSTAPPSETKKAPPKVVQIDPIDQKQPLPATTMEQTLSRKQLEELRSQAAQQSNWVEFLVCSDKLWHSLENTREQKKLVEQAWLIVNSLNENALQEIANSSQQAALSWLSLQQFMQSKSTTKPAMKYARDELIPKRIQRLNLLSFEADAIYQKQLLPRLLKEHPLANRVRQVGVLLPLSGRYEYIGQQIRNGIIKATLQQADPLQLRFYDSAKLAELEATYLQAKQDGADKIIGPLRQEALQELAAIADEDILFLNKTEQSGVLHMPFNGHDSLTQLQQHFAQAQYQRIGLLTNDSKDSNQQAQAFRQQLTQLELDSQIVFYANSKPRLRKALGELIHEKKSQARKNNLRWQLGTPLQFEPRIRQDLDAIVVFDKAERVAVFRPQFDFFALQAPLYGTAQMAPQDFQKITANKDLREVRFLSPPAVMKPENLTNRFEAFGWDSLQASLNMPNLQQGYCILNGKLGRLSLHGERISQQLVWAHYDRNGIIQRGLNQPGQVVAKPRLATRTALQAKANDQEQEQQAIQAKRLEQQQKRQAQLETLRAFNR